MEMEEVSTCRSIFVLITSLSSRNFLKSYKSEDGERLTVVWWRDEKSLLEWRNLMRHREAQSTGG